MNLNEKLRPWNSPMSLSPATDPDKACSRALLEFLDREAPLETSADYEDREKVILELKKVTGDWVKWVSITKRGVPEEDARPGRLFLSGSYRLGVNQKGADIDTILVAPMHVTREDFFSEEEESLMFRLRHHPKVSHVLPIASAYVPLVEVVWSGIELDVLFAGLQQSEVPTHPDQLLDDSILFKVDHASQLSLNGPRTTELIIKSVNNRETFILVLRALRLWAKRKGIYSNKLGFLGGVNFALLAAVACQIWPVETASRCFTRLMVLLNSWKWPAPIRLVHPYEVEAARGNENLQAWDPNTLGRKDKMPIITPAFPNFNSSASVTAATLDIMRGEFIRAEKECKKVLIKGLNCTAADWAAVFTRTDFFVRFPIYVTVVARAPDETTLKKWSGYLESKIRTFVLLLEKLPMYEIFPFQSSFPLEPGKNELDAQGENVEYPGKRWFVGIRVDTVLARLKHVTASAVNLEGAVVSFSEGLLRWEARDPGTTVDVTLFKFKDMLAGFPDMYPEGVREAYKHHRELEQAAQKEMQKSRSLDVKAAAAQAEEEEANSTIALSEDGAAQQRAGVALENLARKRREANNIDLCELDVIPTKTLVVSSGNHPYAPLPFRPAPIRIVELQ